MTAGYSATPLAKKLGIKTNFKLYLLDAPKHYFKLFSDWPAHTEMIEKPTNESVNFVHAFCKTTSDLNHAATYIKVLKKDGLIWISWPKVSSNIQTDLKRDTIREFFLEAGLVDVKVAAIDEDWSGLKFVYRLKDR
ncbi:MAG: DUF3052 family protein [Reichenbachiella sp.]|uniref:DUF3052 family protein n=1 Tax=Reichenbachiella sp. TaxID=2184521 RepID=UPI003264C391